MGNANFHSMVNDQAGVSEESLQVVSVFGNRQSTCVALTIYNIFSIVKLSTGRRGSHMEMGFR